MQELWNFFIGHRQFTYLLMATLVGVGGFSVISIPKESAPQVEIPVAIITTTLRGASAGDVVSLITKRIEKEIATVDNIDKLTSSSKEGVSVITAQFEASANIDKSIQDVKDAVDKAKPFLPKDADEPAVSRVNFSDQPVLIVSLSGGLPPAEFTHLAREIKDEIELVSGVSRVDVSGTQGREVSVVVERESLEALGLNISDVIGAIAASNASMPIGSITVSNIEYNVAFKGDLSEPEDVASLTVGNKAGQPIYLRDIAEIVNGIEKSRALSRVSIDGKPAEPAITLYIYKKSGGDVTVITNTVKTRLEELKPTLLSGISILITTDAGKNVLKDLLELSQVGIETIVLVMLSLFITIGWRESLVAALSIPLSFVIAFIGLYASGNTINFISLFSLILAIGILVDSGIVVTEAIHTRFKKFGDSTLAAKEAIREYAWPLIAGTLTTVAVFVPLFFISGIVGEFISSIPFTIIFVLFASIFVALGFVPLIAIIFTKQEMNRLEMWQEEWNNRAHLWYRSWLGGLLRDKIFQKRFLIGIGVVFFIALLLPITGLTKVIFFPQGESEFIYFEIENKQGSPLYDTDIATRAVEELLYSDKRVQSFVTTIGSGSTFSQSGSSGSKYANVTVTLIPEKDRNKNSTDILNEYRKKFQDFRSFTARAFEPQGGPPSGAPVILTFSGENIDNIEKAVSLGEETLKKIEGTTEVTTSIKDDSSQFALTIDRAKISEAGLSPATIANILRSAVSGATATTIRKNEEDIDVIVSMNLNPEWRDPSETNKVTIDAITNIPISTPKGSILLGSLLSTSLEKSNAVINRENQKNITSVSSYVSKGKTAGEIVKEFENNIKNVKLPEGVTLSIGGETEDVNKSFKEMVFALIGGMTLMLAILVLEFNSFRYALYLLMLIPLSLIGVFTGLAITGEPLSFPSMLGVIALAGIIINHAIILMDSMIVRMKNAGGSLEEAVVDAASSRLRPIILTTITTVVGMIPLANASPLWGPLAFSIMFGLSFAMILTLILVPIIVYRHPDPQYWGAEKISEKV